MKKLLCLILVFSLTVSSGIFAFADCQSNNDGTIGQISEAYADSPTGTSSWSAWIVRSTYNSNAKIESLTEASIWSILLTGLPTTAWTIVGSVVGLIIGSCQRGDTLFYTTTVYQRTDGNGGLQIYTVRDVYTSRSRTSASYLGSITSDIETYNSTVKSVLPAEQ